MVKNKDTLLLYAILIINLLFFGWLYKKVYNLMYQLGINQELSSSCHLGFGFIDRCVEINQKRHE